MTGRVILLDRAVAFAGAALVVLTGGGCTSITLRASEAKTPILIGAVSCMGCAPEPARGAAPPTTTGGVHERDYIFPLLGGVATARVAHDTEPLDLAATKAVTDPCRWDLRVSSIRTGTWGFHVPILFGIVDSWVDVQASPETVPNGTCGRSETPDHERARDRRSP